MIRMSTSEELKSGYEIVFTVTDYYDGPRRGIANLRGKPHLYECVFDEAKDDYSKIFQLTPVDNELFSAALEDWEIWKRWWLAFHNGKTDMASHPALPEDRAGHEDLAKRLHSLKTDPIRSVKQIATFDVVGNSSLPKGVIRPLQVTWTEP
jgi:hypothetical protein